MEVKTALPLSNADGVLTLEAPSPAPSARKTELLAPLQLTPLWEHVVRTRRLPSNVEPSRLFHEVAVRLADLEWQVRQHSLRVLVDVIPAVANQGQLDMLIRPVVLPALVGNLGHAAPAVRKGALDTLRIYLSYSDEPEMALRTIINHGLEGPVALDTRVPLGVILASPSLLHPLAVSGAITSTGLSHLIGALAKKLVLVSYQEPALHALVKIRDMVGETRFQKCLDVFHLASKNDFDVLCQVYEVKPNLGDSGIDLQFVSSDVKQDQESGGYWSDDVQRASSSEGDEQRSGSDRSQFDDKVASGSDSSRDDGNTEQELPNAKVVLETEIQFNEKTAITMTILEEEDDQLLKGIESTESFVMKVLENVEEDNDEEVRRTPRRVRFGGEMVMLRTPDSDPPADDTEETNPKPLPPPTPPIMNIEDDNYISKSKSQIPLPVRPALGLPKIPKKKQGIYTSQNIENTDSQTSSSDSEKFFDEAPGWDELGIVPEQVIDDIHNKENWRARLRGISGLMSAIDSPSTTAVVGSSLPSLLHQLLVTLGEDRCPRVATAAVAAVRELMPRLPHNTLQKLLPQLVLGLTRHMSGSSNVSFKMEAARAVKELMQTCRPAPVVELLLSKYCVAAKSSKMRENALLVLTSSLLTWPSTEFEPRLAASRVAHCVTDPRRRVRQAALECLAVLAQFTGSQYLLGEPMGSASSRLTSPNQRQAARAAVQARLARRQLPTLSEDGLVLYALQVPQSGHKSANGKDRNLSSGPDVEWILAGTGSLSSGSARNRAALSGISSRSHESSSFNSSTSSKAISRNPWTERRIFEESSNFNREKSSSLMAIDVSAISSNDDPPASSFSPWPDETNKHTRISSSAATQRAGRDSSSSSLSPPTNKVSFANGHPVSKPHFLEPLNLVQDRNDKTSTNQIFHKRGRVKENSRRRRDNKQQDWRFEHSGLTTHHGFTPQIRSYHGNTPDFTQPNVLDHSRRFTPNSEITSPKNDLESSSEQERISSAIRSNGIGDNQSSLSVSLGQILTPDQNERPQSNSKENFLTTAEEISFGDRDIVNRKLQKRPNVSDNYILKDMKDNTNEVAEKDEIIEIIDVINDVTIQPSSPGKSSSSSIKTISLTSLTKPEISTYHATTQTSIPAIKLDDDNILLLSSRRRTLPTPSVLELAEAKIAQETKLEETLPQISHIQYPHQMRGRSPPLRRTAKWSDEQPLAIGPENSSSHKSKEELSPLPVNQTGTRRKTLITYKRTNKPSTKRETLSTFSCSKSDKNAQMFPQTIPMKESEVRSAVTQMLHCLKNDEDWEQALNGMRLLVRLLRHHAQSLESNYHSIVLIISEKANDLRSQVARAASQVAVELFRGNHRLSETEVEILSSALLNRTSDTNKFLRGDANFALTTMTRSISPTRAAHALLQKGSSHRNQLVRAATARCLSLIVRQIGAFNILHKTPRTLRDRILSTSVSFLHEGFQETRHEAQEIFRLFVQVSDFNECIRQALPSSKLKELRATLYRLRIL